MIIFRLVIPLISPNKIDCQKETHRKRRIKSYKTIFIPKKHLFWPTEKLNAAATGSCASKSKNTFILAKKER